MDMLKIIVCMLIQVFCFFQLGYLMGVVFFKHYSVKSFSVQLMVGFLSYFSLFQLIALPMILLKMKLSTLELVWGIIVLLILTIPFCHKDYREEVRKIRIRLDLISIIMVLGVVFQTIYAITYYYRGWDTLSYIGRINSALETNTMFLYTGDEGIPHTYINFKHVLSTYYMNSAFFCKVFHLSGFLFQKYIGGGICVIFANLVVYIIAKGIFNKKIAVWSVVFMVFIKYFFNTWATADTFLITRSYEAKAYCGNIILPLIFGVTIFLWKDYKEIYNWKLLFLAAMSSVPISMSAILSTPILIICMIFPLFISKFDKVILKRMLICIFPNAIWSLLHLLYILHVIRIPGVTTI